MRNLTLCILTVAQLVITAAGYGQNSVNTDTIATHISRAKELSASNSMKADSIATLTLNKSLKIKNDSLIAKSYYTLGLANYYGGKHYLSSQYYSKALKTRYAEKNDEFSSSLYNNLGINYEYDNKNQKAIDVYLKSLKKARKTGDSTSIYQTLINIGYLNIELLNYKKAETQLTKALHYFQKTGNDTYTGMCYHNLAILHNSTNDIKQAISEYDKAITFYRNKNHTQKILFLNIDKAQTYLNNGYHRQARPLLDTVMRYTERFSSPYIQGASHLLKGKYYTNGPGKYSRAEMHFRKAEKLFRKSGSNQKIMNVYYNLVRLYAVSNQAEKHQTTLDKYIESLKKNYSRESAEKIAELQTLHKIERKNERMKTLEKTVAQKNRIIRLRTVLGILALIAAVIMLWMYWNIRRKRVSLYKRNLEMTQIIEREQIPEKPEALEDERNDFSQIHYNNLFKQLEEHIIQKKRYLDANLKITDIAHELGTNEKYISQAITVAGNTRFNQLIAFYRINDAKKLLTSPEAASLSIREIALKSGFSNQPSFQRKFKELTGMTPYTFKRMAMKATFQKNRQSPKESQ